MASIGKLPRINRRVQALQMQPAYIDVYTGSVLQQSLGTLESCTPKSPHAHPESLVRWVGSRGFGARHINDTCPFELWDENAQRYKPPNRSQIQYLFDRYGPGVIEFSDGLFVFGTSSPPKPVPLTVAAMPAIFVPPNEHRAPGSPPYLDSGRMLIANAPYVNPRQMDPCPNLSWPRRETAPKRTMLAIISMFDDLVNLQRVFFLSTSIVVELVSGDGRVYEPRSLPSKVAGMPTSYHHDPLPFLAAMKDYKRASVIDPRPAASSNSANNSIQDTTNYVNAADWNILCPGVRLSSDQANSVPLATTCGLRLRKGDVSYVTVASHGFLDGTTVFHPSPDGIKIGSIVGRYPELDIAMLELSSTSSDLFTNATYFEAEPPKRLIEVERMLASTWYEVDTMSTGLMEFHYLGCVWERPVCPPNHPPTPFHSWKLNTIMRIFGATAPSLMDGMCGAPLVEAGTGSVAGFFQKGSGDLAICSTLDNFVADGWEVAE